MWNKKAILIYCALIIGLLILNTRCTYQLEDEIVPPKSIIPQDTFTMLLHDVMVMESFFASQQSKLSSYHEKLPKAIAPIFIKYNVDSTRFLSSLDYYAYQQEVMKEIYSAIQDSLTLNTAKY